MDLAKVPRCNDIYTRLIELAGVSFSLVPENIVLFRLNQCRR